MTIFDDLEAEQQRLDDILASLDDDQWAAPSQAQGWTIADVMLHLAQSEEAVLFSATAVERPGADIANRPPGPPSVITGPAGAFCRVAARRLAPEQSGLQTTGPYADAALHLLRTYAA